MYKNNKGKRQFNDNGCWRCMFSRGKEGKKFSRAYRKFIRNGNDVDPYLHKYGFLYNRSTKRFVYSKNYLDNRYKNKVRLKPKLISSLLLHNNVLLNRTAIVSYFDELDDIVHHKISQFDHPHGFDITLNSAEVDGVSNVFSFSGIDHFQNWYNLIMNGNILSATMSYVGMGMKFKDVMRTNSKHVFRKVLDVYDNIRPIVGGCNDKSLKNIVYDMTRKGPFHTFHLYNPKSKNNNCGIACLKYLDNTNFEVAYGSKRISSIRKEFGIPTKAPLSPQEVRKIYLKYRTDDKLLCFVNETFDGIVKKDYVYLWYKNGHYRVVKKLEPRQLTKERVIRGTLAFDFETRNVQEFDMIGEKKARRLRDTICHIVYKPYKSTTIIRKSFTSNTHKTSARQFLDFLHEQHCRKKHFTCIAHNSANFDFYLILKDMTENEIVHSDIQRRGLSVISAVVFNHMFKDSACFMPASLSSLCDSFKISDENAKLKSFEVPMEDGQTKVLTNMEMCFYKPELNFEQFMQLEKSEPEFWRLYNKYCENDSAALFELWMKFRKAYEEVVTQMGEGTNWMLKAGCTLNGKSTIGGLSKKLLETSMRNNKYYKRYKQFLQEDEDTPTETYPKYEFVCKFKRGGISHCHQAGRHDHKVSSADICSQYPACMEHMKIPIGESYWIYKYQHNRHGFYHCKNVKFRDTRFLPACPNPDKGQSLNWNTGYFAEAYLDSYMIEYMKKHCGLISFDVVKGLVSTQYIRGHMLFAKYVRPLFEAKKLQDKYKKTNDKRYNVAFRNCIKLFLNSLTGKLVENPAKYFQIKYVQGDGEAGNIKGVKYIKTYNNTKPNYWVVAGCMIYSYSKRLLFEYKRLLPTPIIHVETDSLYFHNKALEQFVKNVGEYKGYYPVKFGNDLGNIKLEHMSVGPSYFLGKKFYYLICEEDGEICRIKGIPFSTITDAGTRKTLVNRELYEAVFQGQVVVKEFASIRRTLDGDTRLNAFIQHRTIKPTMEKYPIYT